MGPECESESLQNIRLICQFPFSFNFKQHDCLLMRYNGATVEDTHKNAPQYTQKPRYTVDLIGRTGLYLGIWLYFSQICRDAWGFTRGLRFLAILGASLVGDFVCTIQQGSLYLQ